MMKTYHLKLVRIWLFLGLVLAGLAILLTLLAWVTVSWLSLSVAILYVASIILSVWLNKLPTYERTIDCQEDGFYIQEVERKIKWSDVQWYRVDENSALVEDFVLKVEGMWPLHFRVRPKGKTYNEWQFFKNDVIAQLTQLEMPTPNYYETLFWQLMAWIIMATWPGLIVLMWWLNITFKEILPGFLVYIATSAGMVATIFFNLRQQN